MLPTSLAAYSATGGLIATRYAAISPQESAARSAHFSVPHLGSKTIQHAIDVLVTIDAAERLGQLNGFVDHHLVGNFDVILQFECANQQGCMLYRRQFGNGPINQRRQAGSQVRYLLDRTVQ